MRMQLPSRRSRFSMPNGGSSGKTTDLTDLKSSPPSLPGFPDSKSAAAVQRKASSGVAQRMDSATDLPVRSSISASSYTLRVFPLDDLLACRTCTASVAKRVASARDRPALAWPE